MRKWAQGTSSFCKAEHRPTHRARRNESEPRRSTIVSYGRAKPVGARESPTFPGVRRLARLSVSSLFLPAPQARQPVLEATYDTFGVFAVT